MDIEGLGDRFIEELSDLGYVESVADLYKLKLDDLLEMKRRADERDGTTPETAKSGKVATKWAENLIAAIDRSRETTLERLLHALGIEQVGESTAKALAVWFGDLQLIRRIPWPLFKRVPDIGGEVARSLGHFLDQRGNQQVLDALLKHGVRVTDAHPPSAKLREGLDFAAVLGIWRFRSSRRCGRRSWPRHCLPPRQLLNRQRRSSWARCCPQKPARLWLPG